MLAAIVTALGNTKPRSAVATCSRTGSQAKRLQILLAEDNRVNQIVATRMAERMGHSVVVAENGRFVLELLARRRFDLVLMDVQMPEMDGLTATRKIRESERRTHLHLPIIAMTAHAMKGDRERCLEAGMDGYLTKPINSQRLEEAIASNVPLQADWRARRARANGRCPSRGLGHGANAGKIGRRRNALLRSNGNFSERCSRAHGRPMPSHNTGKCKSR